jgi:hypothetical protein
MVAALLNHETIFTVLGSSARGRAERSLALQVAMCLIASGAIAFAMPQWWSVAALLFVGAMHATWGLLAHRFADRPSLSAGSLRHVPLLLAALATGAAVVGVVGLAIALFTGQGRSPYDPCGPGASSAYCRALKQPRPATSIP